MKHRWYALAGLVAVAALHGSVPALAQGSTGGDIGKQDKAVSGDRDAPRPSRRESPKRERSGGGGNFDGTWTSVAISNNGCSGTSKATVTISGGRVSTNDGLSGTVSSGGSKRAVWSSGGMTGTLVGRFSGQSGQGTFKRSDGCSGSWSMAKQ